MKRAFSLIELIFVIIILGTLVGIATNRLLVNKDDASVVVTATNIRTLFSSLQEYYAINGALETASSTSENILEMTGIALPLKISDEICLDALSLDKQSVTFKIGEGGNCASVWEFDYLKGIKAQLAKNANKLQIGGSRIRFK